MAKSSPTNRKTSSTITFDTPTVLVNCMTPCSKCDIIHPFIDEALKEYCKNLGYALETNYSNNKTVAIWKQYGKPNKVGQTTPQIYAINGSKVSGIALAEGTKVGGYIIPSIKSWNRKMLEDVIAELCKKVS